jgi:hypothetical protein
LAKAAMCCDSYGKDHETGGEHVQPVDRRLGNHRRKEAAQSGRRTICFFSSSTGYRQESSRFIDDDDVCVVVKNVHKYPWGAGPSSFGEER